MNTRHRPETLTPANLIRLCKGAVKFATKHRASLPNGGVEVDNLDQLTDALQAAEKARAADVRERRTAVKARTPILKEARRLYNRGRRWATVGYQRKGNEALGALVGSCPAPSHLDTAELPLMMEELAAGAEVNAAALAGVGMEATLVADLRAQAQALREAVDAVAAAESDRGEASSHRTDARADLVNQYLLLEEQMKLNLRPAQLKGLDTLRNRYLPRYSTPAKASA